MSFLSKGISKKEIRDFYKNKAGIILTEKLKKSCGKSCFFNTDSKYFSKHQIKTRVNESCSKFKTQRVHKVHSGRSISPKPIFNCDASDNWTIASIKRTYIECFPR